jgi:hypothetical protein
MIWLSILFDGLHINFFLLEAPLDVFANSTIKNHKFSLFVLPEFILVNHKLRVLVHTSETKHLTVVEKYSIAQRLG